jgi:hypothetical protein
MDTDPKDIATNLKISGCVSHSSVIKYFVSVIFSFIICMFCIAMIATSANPSSETLWVSILTSTVGVLLPSPQIKK